MSDVLQIDLPRAEPVVHQVQRLRLGDLELCEESQRASWKGAMISLTLGEFRVLRLLVTAGRDVAYTEIYETVKPAGFVCGRYGDGFRVNVRTIIKRVRAKFRDVDPAFDHIRTYNGFGYAWRAPAGQGAGA